MKLSFFRYTSLASIAAALGLLGSGCAAGFDQDESVEESERAATGLAMFEPPSGAYFGVSLDTNAQSVASFNSTMGFPAVSYVMFAGFPLSSGDTSAIQNFVNQVNSVGGISVITLEPNSGLDAVNSTAVNNLITVALGLEAKGARMMIRFAHEMNGGWYIWGQKPSKYRNAFRLLATTVHSKLKRTAMIWAPNSGGGYPWPGQKYQAKPGTQDYRDMDTNHDGTVNGNDDAFSPYYPGDDVVDWVGLSLYHWGNPFGSNTTPTPYEFSNGLTGGSTNFYTAYSGGGHNKPMVLAEIGAVYNTSKGGSSEYDIKTGWYKQVYNISGASSSVGPDIANTFPHIRMINWFEYRKYEASIGATIDWRISSNSSVRSGFVQNLQKLKNGKKYFLNLTDFKALKY